MAGRDILESEQDIDPAVRYVKIVLDEPAKGVLQEYEEYGTVPPREAFIILCDSIENTTYEASVSLTEGEVISWEEIEGVQPSITPEE